MHLVMLATAERFARTSGPANDIRHAKLVHKFHRNLHEVVEPYEHLLTLSTHHFGGKKKEESDR